MGAYSTDALKHDTQASRHRIRINPTGVRFANGPRHRSNNQSAPSSPNVPWPDPKHLWRPTLRDQELLKLQQRLLELRVRLVHARSRSVTSNASTEPGALDFTIAVGSSALLGRDLHGAHDFESPFDATIQFGIVGHDKPGAAQREVLRIVRLPNHSLLVWPIDNEEAMRRRPFGSRLVNYRDSRRSRRIVEHDDLNGTQICRDGRGLTNFEIEGTLRPAINTLNGNALTPEDVNELSCVLQVLL